MLTGTWDLWKIAVVFGILDQLGYWHHVTDIMLLTQSLMSIIYQPGHFSSVTKTCGHLSTTLKSLRRMIWPIIARSVICPFWVGWQTELLQNLSTFSWMTHRSRPLSIRFQARLWVLRALVNNLHLNTEKGHVSSLMLTDLSAAWPHHAEE